VYVVSPQLRGGLGIALIDSGAMVYLVKESSVKRFERQAQQVELQGITGKQMNVLGLIDLKIENTTEDLNQKCYVVDSLPRNLDVILGQDWLENAGYSIQKKVPVIIPPYSEQVIKCRTNKRGVRFIEHQLLEPGLIAASSLVNCESNEFSCLVVNLTNQSINVITSPKLEKPPTMSRRQDVGSLTRATDVKRLQLLKEKLRLNHITEGANDIKRICEEYVDIFKLPGDSLTATTATEHTIPTPTIPKGRAITLRNYRLPESQQHEVKEQITQMLKDEIIIPSKSEWNFPLIVVPKRWMPQEKRNGGSV
jgi:hypothetical protein